MCLSMTDQNDSGKSIQILLRLTDIAINFAHLQLAYNIIGDMVLLRRAVEQAKKIRAQVQGQASKHEAAEGQQAAAHSISGAEIGETLSVEQSRASTAACKKPAPTQRLSHKH